jgi:hypothetical protein
VGVQKANIIEPQPSVEEGIAEMPNIHICLTSRICERAGCLRNRVLLWPLSKHLKTVVFTPQQRK